MTYKTMIQNMLGCSGKRIAVDLDGTLTKQGGIDNFINKSPTEVMIELESMVPDQEIIDIVNELAKNNVVYIYTARNDIYQEVTMKWLKKHGVSHQYLVVNKEYYDYFIDDKCINPVSLK